MIKFEKDIDSPTTDKVTSTTPCVQRELPCYVVRVAEMKESHRTTYWVVLERSDRPKDAKVYDSKGRITPFMHENKEYADSEAEKWAEFLGVQVTT